MLNSLRIVLYTFWYEESAMTLWSGRLSCFEWFFQRRIIRNSKFRMELIVQALLNLFALNFFKKVQMLLTYIIMWRFPLFWRKSNIGMKSYKGTRKIIEKLKGLKGINILAIGNNWSIVTKIDKDKHL